jgi:hypothetical protein
MALVALIAWACVTMAALMPPSSWRLRRLHVDAVVLRLGWLSASQRRAAQAACHVAYRDHAEEICIAPSRT